MGGYRGRLYIISPTTPVSSSRAGEAGQSQEKNKFFAKAQNNKLFRALCVLCGEFNLMIPSEVFQWAYRRNLVPAFFDPQGDWALLDTVYKKPHRSVFPLLNCATLQKSNISIKSANRVPI